MFATALVVASLAGPVGGEIEGPRVGARVVAGENVTLWGAAGEGRKVLAAGDADVMAAVALGCPPDDADLWLADDATPGFLQAASEQLRPDVTVVFGRARRSAVAGDGPDARRYAAWAGVPFTHAPGASHINVTLARRAGPRTASRLAYGIDRLSGSRFAQGAHILRRDLLAHGDDPRRHGKT